MVFALNTTIRCATKCVPYEIIHRREVILPADVKLGTSTEKLGRDILSASDFAEELKLKLQKTYETINANMSKYRERMSNAYNNGYSAGDKVWLQIKSVKKGLSRSKTCPPAIWSLDYCGNLSKWTKFSNKER